MRTVQLIDVNLVARYAIIEEGLLVGEPTAKGSFRLGPAGLPAVLEEIAAALQEAGARLGGTDESGDQLVYEQRPAVDHGREPREG